MYIVIKEMYHQNIKLGKSKDFVISMVAIEFVDRAFLFFCIDVLYYVSTIHYTTKIFLLRERSSEV